MSELTVVEITADDTHELRLEVLRNDTPTAIATFPEDDLPGTFHLGVRDSDNHIVAISTWIPRPFHDEPAVQLRGRATPAPPRSAPESTKATVIRCPVYRPTFS